MFPYATHFKCLCVVSVAPTLSDLTVHVTEGADRDTTPYITEGVSLDFECVVSSGITPAPTVLWDIGGVTSYGNTVTRTITDDTTATCLVSNDASSYTGGTLSKQVAINMSRKLN